MKRNWWKESVVYQIFPKSFCDDNGDGYGDIKGIISKLDYLAELGVDTVWVCPFFKSPMVDNGYDICDYTDIEPIFGDMADMDDLIKKAKDLNIKVLVDLVLNHTSRQHPWFIDALLSEDSPYRNYYIFKKTDDGLPPNNWRSVFGGSSWENIGNSTFYLHTFHEEQPDLNWENPKMRQELYKIVKFWIYKGVYGFRIDAITFIKKNFLSNDCESDNDDGLRYIGKDTLNQPGIHEFLKEMKEATYGTDDYMTVAEAPGVSYDDLKAYVGDDGDFSMIFDFSYTDIDLQEGGFWYPKRNWTVLDYKEKIFTSQLEHQKVGWIGLFNESHDQPRSIDKFFGIGGKSKDDFLKATVLATMYFFMRGTPFIYQGQELGITNYTFTELSECDDIAAIDHYKRALSLGATNSEALNIVNERSRDHARTPMLWNSEKNAGFSSGKPWLPIHENYKQINAEKQLKEEKSVYKFYKQMIELRKTEKECFVYGEFQPILKSDINVIAYQRITNQGKVITVLTNFSDSDVEVKNYFECQQMLLNNYLTPPSEDDFAKGKLRPYEAIVLKQV